MPLPRWLGHFNLHVTNRVLGPLAKVVPGMGIVLHVGRKTHRQYRTPVMTFSHGNLMFIALTYGRDSQWVQNVLASDGCRFETQGRTLRLSHPRLLHDEQRRAVPAFVRVILGMLHVSDFLELTIEERSI